MLDIGLFILRIVLGITFMGHGAQKLFGWFEGPGLKGFAATLERGGVRPAGLWAVIAALSEFGGGLLLFLGFLTPLGSLGIIASMLVAIIQVHLPNGFWNTKRGIEFPLINLTAALALALTGPGAYSLDAIFRSSLPEPAAILIGLVLVILGVIVEQASRSHPAASTTAGEPPKQS